MNVRTIYRPLGGWQEIPDEGSAQHPPERVLLRRSDQRQTTALLAGLCQNQREYEHGRNR